MFESNVEVKDCNIIGNLIAFPYQPFNVNVNWGYGNWKKAAYGELFPASNKALPLTSSKVTVITGKKLVLMSTLIDFIPRNPLSTAPGVPFEFKFWVI